jgi:solute carrier family 25 phosphate transporter 3
MRTVIAEETAIGLVKGWIPTAIGYSLQGAGKFGLYELFKDAYSNLLGEDGSYRHRAAVYAAASGSAEFVADVLLCPMEMVKVRVARCHCPAHLVG